MKHKQKIAYYTGNEALAYSDVYLQPQYSNLKSRFNGQINTATMIAIGAPKLNIPFVSAGMDTVTEDNMAITLALYGGMGEIHRNNTPDRQAMLVRNVKEKMRVMENNPPVVAETATINDALNILDKRKRGYVIVYPGNKFEGAFSGMATDRDFISSPPETLISEVMTPLIARKGRKLITGSVGISLVEAVDIMKVNRIEKLPVVDSKNKLVGVYTFADYKYIQKHPNAAIDSQGRLVAGAAIGVHEIDVERTHKLVEAGVDVLFIDIAHGHSVYTKEMLKRLKIKEKIKVPIVVGNFATSDGVLFAYEMGADGIKVGIGPGFTCKTRNVAGTGVPQISAILEAKEALAGKRNAPPINADGGNREPGDPPKALACGADTVMIGTVFAGSDASPGDVIKVNGTLQKRVRGMASKAVAEDRAKIGSSTTKLVNYAPEGRETFVHYQGPTINILNEYVGGLRSAMSYTGSHTIKELQKAKLIHVSSHGANEQVRDIA